MSCIVGLADGDKVWMGADSASASEDNWAMRRVKAPKVFSLRIGETDHRLLIGYTSSFRMGQILQHHLEIAGDVIPFAGGEQWYLIKRFIPLVRRILREQRFTKVESNQEEGGVFLVGMMGHVFRVDIDFHVNESLDGYEAIGCGADFALGALWSASNALMDAVPALKEALQAAAHFSAGVVEPFHIYMLPSVGEATKVAL